MQKTPQRIIPKQPSKPRLGAISAQLQRDYIENVYITNPDDYRDYNEDEHRHSVPPAEEEEEYEDDFERVEKPMHKIFSRHSVDEVREDEQNYEDEGFEEEEETQQLKKRGSLEENVSQDLKALKPDEISHSQG